MEGRSIGIVLVTDSRVFEAWHDAHDLVLVVHSLDIKIVLTSIDLVTYDHRHDITSSYNRDMLELVMHDRGLRRRHLSAGIVACEGDKLIVKVCV